jgi:hypothetical protein
MLKIITQAAWIGALCLVVALIGLTVLNASRQCARRAGEGQPTESKAEGTVSQSRQIMAANKITTPSKTPDAISESFFTCG